MDLFLSILVGAALAVFFTSFGALVVGRRAMPQRSTGSKLKTLKKLPLFRSLSDAELVQVAGIVRELHVPANAYVVRENKIGEALYVVRSGSLQVLKRGARDQTLVQTVGEDEIIGEMAVLTGARRIASVRSVTSCILMQIMRDDFADLLKGHPAVGAAVWAACEVHSIDLGMRDHERTRALPLDERRAWIDQRQSFETAVGEALSAPASGYVAVVAGVVERGGHVFQAPELVQIAAGDAFRVNEAGKLAWLPEPRTAA